jgi:hypothetical protein
MKIESVTDTDESKIPFGRVLGLTTGLLIIASTITSGVFKKIASTSAGIIKRN